jgi:dTDP-4-amino-4,6-dideoxygalactose transaminase
MTKFAPLPPASAPTHGYAPNGGSRTGPLHGDATPCFGGSSTRSRFPAPAERWPRYAADEIQAAVRVLASGRVNSLVHGDECRSFEHEFAEYIGMPHALSLANGTVALELAFRALGVGAGDEVIVPARSFFASASAVVAAGAVPIFADILGDSHNIDPADVARLISPRTRAILCVHLAGWPCDMAALSQIARDNGLWLVEDCAQAHGAAIDGRKAGSFGDAAAFSFCTDKIMSTGGEGGILLLRDEAVMRRAWAYKDHGKSLEKMGQGSLGFRYVHDSFGTNWRMTEMQAAIGRVQLRKLPVWLERRRSNAEALRQLLRGHPLVQVPDVPPEIEHACYRLYVMLDTAGFAPGTGRADVLAAMLGTGINAGTGCCPDMSREQAVLDSSHPNRRPLPVAADIGERSLMLPVDHLLGRRHMQFVASTLMEALDAVMPASGRERAPRRPMIPQPGQSLGDGLPG